MRYKIVRFQKLMWHNMMRSTKNKKVSVLHYSIDNHNMLFVVKIIINLLLKLNTDILG